MEAHIHKADINVNGSFNALSNDNHKHYSICSTVSLNLCTVYTDFIPTSQFRTCKTSRSAINDTSEAPYPLLKCRAHYERGKSGNP